MMKIIKKIRSIIILILLAVSGILIIVYLAGYKVNTTKSIPIGIYQESSKTPDKYDYVLFCPPDIEIFREAKRRGYINTGICPDSYGYLMKKIMAKGGDIVTLTEQGVFVNAELLAFSTPLKTDSYGRELPTLRLNQILKPTEVLLMSDVSETSFDARYFGILESKQIKGVITPVLIF
ncbi:conjugative transfer signal peptidase TraF [Zophobihabitans entericus]|uniref:Conjugative transfer signal peptidase TraF n=1 Tax=Zophobihabitans entericus TaxID=1635327 RepID=A0A6G9IE65_9GAMM|nr:conjugative transfer signal peptidase TraF [Zophobihabitans entericus]QIQ22528.1 conjugative transfer signal peptidase TraF [Zophobihabitans entericus]